MAKYRVNDQIVEANSDEEASEKYLASQQQPPAAEPVQESSILSPLMQGLTFGFADELGGVGSRIGAAMAGAGPERRDELAERETQRQREELAATRDEMFWTSLALEGAGALVSGGPAFKGLQALGKGIGLGNIAAPIAAGATEGGVAGAGAADESKIAGAALGATLGGGATAAMPALGGLATATGEKLAPYGNKLYEMTVGGAPNTASRVISDAVTGGGVTPTLMRAKQRQLGPEATFVDVAGAPGQTLGQGVIQADKTGQALINARRELAKRAGGSTRRLEDDIRGTTGINKTLDQSLEAVRERQQKAAASNYELANRQTISLTPKLKNLLSRPPMEKAFKEAKDAAATRGEKLPPFFQLDNFGDWQKSITGSASNKLKQNDVIYVSPQMGRKVEVIQNPTTKDIQQMSQEVRREFPDMQSGTPKVRWTEDPSGNRYMWRADKGTHDSIETGLKQTIGGEFNQNGYFDAPTRVIPDMQAWDRMKQSIDRMIEGQTDAVTGRVSPRGRDLTMLKKELVKELDEINPAYRTARNAFAGDAEIESAMRNGERFLNMKTREVTKAMDGATDSEKEAFLTGAVEAIREKMGRARAGEIGEFKFLEQGNTRKKLRSIFPEGNAGDRQMGELMRALNRERTFATTQGSLVGGSQTALRQSAGNALDSGVAMPTSTEALINPLGAGLNAAMQAASKSLRKTGPKALTEMSGMMFDPSQLNRTILEMERRGIKPADMMGIMERYSRGGARMAPLIGLGAGEMMNDAP